MTVRVGEILFPGWESLALPGGWSDTFVFRMAPTDGLPPADYARVLYSLAAPVRRLRRSASLWVQVAAQGSWFSQEVRHALRGLRIPVAVADAAARPELWDFSFYPWLSSRSSPAPPTARPLYESDLSSSELRCLRVLGRADCAYTAEVASLAHLDLSTTRQALRGLEKRRLVGLVMEGRYPRWEMRRSGLSLALRSWGLPPGKPFPWRKERGYPACKERGPYGRRGKDVSGNRKPRSSAGRHRRTARLWPAWLHRAWPLVEVWAGWSEVVCERARPDALCWGNVDGQEALFWLEVESGTISREALQRKTLQRVNRALVYARRCPVRLVFALLGPPWVRTAVVKVFTDLPADVAVVLEDWKAFGTLPNLEWGRVRWA